MVAKSAIVVITAVIAIAVIIDAFMAVTIAVIDKSEVVSYKKLVCNRDRILVFHGLYP